jgi:CBS domain-containing protein
MTRRVVTVPADTPLDEVIATMEDYQIRRVPVVDDIGCCAGIIAQADIAANEAPRKTAELVCEISRDMGVHRSHSIESGRPGASPVDRVFGSGETGAARVIAWRRTERHLLRAPRQTIRTR